MEIILILLGVVVFVSIAVAYGAYQESYYKEKRLHEKTRPCPTCDNRCAKNATTCPKCGHNF